MKRFSTSVFILFLILSLLAVTAQDSPDVTLIGYAVLPADTFADGPASGAALDLANGRTPPFESQPVQGFSGIIPAENGNYFVILDNGYGRKDNSSDFNLRWYEVAVDWENSSVEVVDYRQLSDPDNHISWPIVNGDTPERILTGADLDPESFRQVADGTFWIGDEFGPYLLHFDADGKLLEIPIHTPYINELSQFARGLPFIQSPDHPDFVSVTDAELRGQLANLGSSKGIEGIGMNSAGTILYPLLEGALVTDPNQTHLLIRQFLLETTSYSNEYWFYRLENSGHAIGEMTAVGDETFLILERDNNQGADAAFKRIFKINLKDVESDGHTLKKTLVVDLLAIHDVSGLTQAQEGVIGYGSDFKFPFITIESVYVVDAQTLLIVNDNNYPGSAGRRPNVPDDNEFILLQLPTALDTGVSP
jgi:hypothetical protein